MVGTLWPAPFHLAQRSLKHSSNLRSLSQTEAAVPLAEELQLSKEAIKGSRRTAASKEAIKGSRRTAAIKGRL